MARATTQGFHHLPVVVIDQDRSALSRELITALGNTEEIAVAAQLDSPAQLDRWLAQNDAVAAITLPPRLEADLAAGRPQVQIIVDGSQSAAATYALGAAQGAINAVVARRTAAQSRNLAVIVVDSQVRYNPTLNVSFFVISATGTITSYAWDFGDAGTSTLQSPAHTYTTAGTYSVNLNVTGPGGIEFELRTNYISVGTPPGVPRRELHRNTDLGQLSVIGPVRDQSTGSITSYAWDFGDAGPSTLQSPAHTYTTAGTYSVNLNVTGPGGDRIRETQDELYFSGSTSGSPPCRELHRQHRPRATLPLSVQFRDQSTGSITSYAWDFGDAGTPPCRVRPTPIRQPVPTACT